MNPDPLHPDTLHPDALHPGDFHATALGRCAADLIAARVAQIWPTLARLTVLGVGHPFPFLDPWRGQCERCLAATLAPVPPLPKQWPGLACIVDDDGLPFPDLSIDRVLIVHGLEHARGGARLLREAWRVLRDDGRLIVVAPNRRGAWAHLETTPFGQGQPYSRGQIDRLLTRQAFRIERRDSALYLPPLPWLPVSRVVGACDTLGRSILPAFGGVTITEAVKDVLGVTPILAARASRGRLPRRVLAEA